MTPATWKRYTLDDLSHPRAPIRYGVVQVGPFTPGGVPIVPIKHIGRIGRAHLHLAAREIERSYANSRIQGGDVLLSVKGTIGEVGLVPEGFDGNIAREIARIRPNEKVEGQFLASLLSAPETQRRIDALVVGTTRREFSIAAARAFEVLLPPLPEQRRIAEILSTWDRAIETVEALIANAREQKAALMQALLTGKRRLPGFNQEWAWRKFSDVFERVRKKNDVGDTNVLTISAQHGLVSQTDYFNKVVASDDVRGYTLLHRGDFAYNKSYSDGYPFGAFKPLDRYDRGIVSSLYICFRLANADHNHDFMRHYFEAGLFNREVAAIAQEGARNHGLLNVSVVDFFDASLHTPAHDEQVAIADVINGAERKEWMLIGQRDALREEKVALMQELLTGKRRVNAAESDAA